MKVVINKCYGGFGLSEKAMEWMRERGCKSDWYGDLERNDPLLVECVETLREAANGEYAELKIVDIPDDISWYIDEYDGIERIHEEHDSW